MPAAFGILKSVDKFLRIYYVREMEVYHKLIKKNKRLYSGYRSARNADTKFSRL